ncbi:MAG: SDR family NAD(P)-dependent oxidoreductase, partial [Herbaspirillum sp.]
MSYTALVTGGTGGLGQAIARALHDDGHTVLVACSLNHQDVDEWLAVQAADGYVFHLYRVDVADEVSCQAMADQIRVDGHHVDILVNNAGIVRDG